MKKKKGFTLIELLAVIVILAVIALIATPAIINVIENARKKAFENTSYGVLESLRLDYVERVMSENSNEDKEFDFSNTNVGLKLSGEIPKYGKAKIDNKGNISIVLADKDKKWCAKKESSSEKITIEEYSEENCKIYDSSTGDVNIPIENGTVIFFNPESGTKCNDYNESQSEIEVNKGCMKWYTFDGNNTKNTVNLILDHNTYALIEYNSSVSNKEPKEIKIKLEENVKNWMVGLNPRLITADEIAQITGNTNFNSLTSGEDDMFYFDTNTSERPVFQGSNKSKFDWLYNNTISCIKYGCSKEDDGTYGYWTSTKLATNETDVWRISRYGYMKNTSSDNNNYGIRPVITISKNVFK